MSIASAAVDRSARDGATGRPAGNRPAGDRSAVNRPAGKETAPPRCPTVAHVMSRRPATVDAHTSLVSAWGRLHGEQGEHLVVIDEAARPIGVLDERDIALEWPPGPLGAHHRPVQELLRFRALPRVHASDSLATAALAMLEARADALPVVDEDGRLTGLVTARHCVELVAAMYASHAA
jgi:CBS domain-containing protein